MIFFSFVFLCSTHSFHPGEGIYGDSMNWHRRAIWCRDEAADLAIRINSSIGRDRCANYTTIPQFGRDIPPTPPPSAEAHPRPPSALLLLRPLPPPFFPIPSLNGHHYALRPAASSQPGCSSAALPTQIGISGRTTLRPRDRWARVVFSWARGGRDGGRKVRRRGAYLRSRGHVICYELLLLRKDIQAWVTEGIAWSCYASPRLVYVLVLVLVLRLCVSITY